MIVARIDNEICTRTPYRRGRSFKGALAYLLRGARDAPNPERVLHAETVNIWSDLSDAAHEMAATWENRFRLMADAGLSPRNGADNRAPVYHLVLSWGPDETAPAPQEMADVGKHLLHLLGLGEHEAVLVVHGDTANPHIHIIVNTVHPLTGRTAALRFDKRVMQDFAARYEELRGELVCHGRFTPDVRSAFNRAAQQPFSRRRENRPQWERQRRAEVEARRAALPSVILETLTRHDATFTPAQLARAVTDASRGAAEFATLMAAVQSSPELVRLSDGEGRTRYTTRTQQEVEARLARSAALLAGSIAHAVPTATLGSALAKFSGPEQAGARDALRHLLAERGLSIIVGYAGAGKSTLLRAATDAWSAAGYTCRGLALAGRAAEGLEADAGLPSGTIAGFLIGLDNGVIKLTAQDIVVIDEAGMVASRQLDRVLHAVREAGAKVVLVGDPEQLQAIEAGGPFRYLVDRFDHARLAMVWRQSVAWMRQATIDLAEGRTAQALATYKANGMLAAHRTKADAVESMLDMWLANREAGLSQLMLTATNADAAIINAAARLRLHAMDALGPETEITTADGPCRIAVGDRIVFRRNDKTLGVKNGTTATVTDIIGSRLAVTTDGRSSRVVQFDTERYPDIAHGYAVTIHKSQGATVDRAYVLAAPNMDRHSAYVALTRHRERVSLHWSQDVFRTEAALTRHLSRKRLKDVTLDYRQAILAGVRALNTSVRVRAFLRSQLRDWRTLYRSQAQERRLFRDMSLIRRAFWMAAHLTRFAQTGAASLLKLHERERGLLFRRLRDEAAPVDGTVARPSAAAVLGLRPLDATRQNPRVQPEPPRPG